MGDFEQLTAPHPLPGPLLGMAEHLAGLGFAEEPDYDYLMQVLSGGQVENFRHYGPSVVPLALESYGRWWAVALGWWRRLARGWATTTGRGSAST